MSVITCIDADVHKLLIQLFFCTSLYNVNKKNNFFEYGSIYILKQWQNKNRCH